MSTRYDLLRILSEQKVLEEEMHNKYNLFLTKIKNGKNFLKSEGNSYALPTSMRHRSKVSNSVDNQAIYDKIKENCDDEEEHMRICDELIELVNGSDRLARREESYLETLPAMRVKENHLMNFKDGKSTLILTDSGNCTHDLISLFRSYIADKKVIYICYNKFADSVKNCFKKKDIDIEEIVFINCSELKTDSDLSVLPENLTELYNLIGVVSGDIKNPLILIDNLSFFDCFHKKDTILKFVSSVNNFAKEKEFKVLWTCFNDDSLSKEVSDLCDHKIYLEQEIN